MEIFSVRFSLPSPSLFQFPPRNDPQTLQPTSIVPSLYLKALDVTIPITASCVYAATVQALNAYNRSNGSKPWRISKTKSWFYLVVLHNILLAIYSTWTFIGMFGALTRTVQSPAGPTGLVGFVDSLCKIHGTAGLGNGITYRPATSQWVYDLPLKNDRSPNPDDRGRLWNEGLSFYGWIFYGSKIYEFLDTVIILTKGKKGSILQVYHHIGALMCTWAGIRYMSSPIWIPTFVNSGIHSLMYTYYTLTAFGIPIPGNLKKSLTIVQIIQLVFSDLLAGLYLFVSYIIPIEIGDPMSPGISSAVALPMRLADPRYSQPTLQYSMQNVSCIDTSGQAFAAWMSVLYLTPLIWLFSRFYAQSYRKEVSGRVKERDGKRGSRREGNRHGML